MNRGILPRVEFAFKVKGDIANPLHSTNIRRYWKTYYHQYYEDPNYEPKSAPGTYLLFASAKVTHHGPVNIR